MNLSITLFLIGILGFILNRKNIILLIISIELMLLAVTFMILISSFAFDDILGEIYAIYDIKKYQHQSIGSALFDEAIQFLKKLGFSEFFIWVLKDNINAQRFYQKYHGIESSNSMKKIGDFEYEEIQFKFHITNEN